MEFVIEGKIVKNKNDITEFKKQIKAESENHAKELIFSFFGSKNGLKRSMIKINSVTKV